MGGGKAHEGRATAKQGFRWGQQLEQKRKSVTLHVIMCSFPPHETLRHVLGSWVEAAPNAGFC